MTTAPQSPPTPRYERLLIERLPHGGWVVYHAPADESRPVLLVAYPYTGDMLDGLVQLVL